MRQHRSLGRRCLARRFTAIPPRRATRGPGASWAYRRFGRLEAAADIHGRPVSGSMFRCNGSAKFAGDLCDPLDPLTPSRPETRRLFELRRRVSKARAQYRQSGMFSEVETKLMEALFDGMSISEFGRHLTT